MRITKVYTRGGDQGQTSLIGGKRVGKATARVAAYGDIDEVNSVIGVVRSHIHDGEIDEVLKHLQNDLFTLGADLASPPEVQGPRISADHIAKLEATIDRYLQTLPPLKEFILPSGVPSTAFLHLARTVARRAERSIVLLAEVETVSPEVLAYVNRLSDLFFVLARVVNQRSAGNEDQVHFGEKPKPRP